jgi:autotransporter-associated beta strand protein
LGTLPGVSNIAVNGGVLAVNRSNTFNQAVDLNGVAITGAGGFSQIGTGTTILSAANSHTGTTTISGGTLRLGGNDASSSGNHVVETTLDLNGHLQSISGLSGTGIIDNASPGSTATLTVGLNNANSNFGGILRNSGDSAILNLAKAGSGTLVLGAANPLGGSVTVNGGTLAFTNTAPLQNASGITLSGGAELRPDVVNGVIHPPVTVGAAGTTATIHAPSIVGAGGTSPVPVTLNGPISGAGNVRFLGTQSNNAYGHIILKAAGDYAGSTLITTTGGNRNIFVRVDTPNALPATTVLTLDGGNGDGGGRFCDLNLNGNHQTLAGLTNVTGRTLRTQRIRNTSSTPAILTIHNTANFTYTGQLGNTGTNLSLTKSGPGTQSFTGALNYSGNTTVLQGTLSLGSANAGNDGSTVTIAGTGAALELNFAGSDTVDQLFIGTIQQQAGIYGAVGSADPVIGIPQITGTGTLTVTSNPSAAGYESWALVNAGGQNPDLDFDNDGVPNGIEYVLGGSSTTNDLAKLPTATFQDGLMVFTFVRDQASIDGSTAVAIEVGNNLSGWPDVYPVPDTAVAGSPGLSVLKNNPVEGRDTIILTLPPDPSGKTFARLKVIP